MYNIITAGDNPLINGATGIDLLKLPSDFGISKAIDVNDQSVGQVGPYQFGKYSTNYIAIDVERAYTDDRMVAFDVFGDAPANTGYVFKLYQVALDRMADIDGISYWTSISDSLGRQDTATLAQAFTDASEFLNFDDQSNEDLVSRLYESAFHREADAGGLEFWTGFLDGGGDVAQVVEAFALSDEMSTIWEAHLSGGIILNPAYFDI